jgi:UDP-glucose 4-epimerase
MQGAPEEQYFKINRDLDYEVAKRAKEHGVKHFVLMSTAKVFGESTTNKPAYNENSDCKPLDAYGKSKYEAEKLIHDLEDDNFKVAIVRSPLVYGAGVKANMYNLLKLVDRLPILPLGGVQNKRSIVYVGNLIALLKHIIEVQASGVFIAGDRLSLSTTELTQIIGRAFNKSILLPQVPFIRSIVGKLKPTIIERLFGSLELDNSLTNKILGFVPPFSTEEGIKEMVEWYKHNK